MKRIKEVTESTVFDFNNDKVVSSEREKTYVLSQEEEYFKVYKGSRRYFGSLPATCIKVLYDISYCMNYVDDGMEVVMTSDVRHSICENTKISLKTLKNTLTELIKRGALIHKSQGVYKVNPFIVGKGHWKDIAKYREEERFFPCHLISESPDKETPSKEEIFDTFKKTLELAKSSGIDFEVILKNLKLKFPRWCYEQIKKEGEITL